MAGLNKKTVANEFGETVVTAKTQYISETRKDVLISRKTEAKMFKTLRYYNWSKSFGMKTPFLNNLANGAYGTLQMLNDLSAFTSDNVVRSLAARYGWVVAGRAFGKVQGRVLPQGGGPLGRFMRVKGGQFSRKILGDFMNYFTTTEMTFENVVKTQRSIMKQLDMAGGIGPTWSAMALAEAIGNAPDPYASNAVKIRGKNRDKDLAETAFADGDAHTIKYLQKRTDVLKSLSASGASAPEMTYLIQAMEHGYDPDDIMRKVTEKDKSIKKILNPLQNQRNTELRNPLTNKELSKEGLVDYSDDGTSGYQNTVFEELDKLLGLNLSSDMSNMSDYQSLETIFSGNKRDLGGQTPHKLRFDKKEIFSKNKDKPKAKNEYKRGKGSVIKMETAEDLVATDYYNYREVYSSNDIREDNYIASRPQIIKGLRIMDTQYLHAKNPKGGFMIYGIEFFQHRGIRDIQQIEFGGPATDKRRSLKKRLDRYVYPRSMFLHSAAQEAANKLGIDAKLKFSKKTSDVLGTVAQRRTNFLADINKGNNKKNSKDGEFSLIADMKLRNAMKNDLIRARNPRVTDGNKVNFKDIKLSEELIPNGPTGVGSQDYKGFNTIYLKDPKTGKVEPMKLDRKDYPAEYLNAFDRLEENLKSNIRPNELSKGDFQIRAAVMQDAELRESINLDGKLGVNEFGNRRYQAPGVMRNQNYTIKGGVQSVDDIIGQAIKNAEERAFKPFFEKISAEQIKIEAAADKVYKEKVKQIDENFKKNNSGTREAHRMAVNDAQYERDQTKDIEYTKAYDRITKEFMEELHVDLNVTSLDDVKHPIVREEIRKLTNTMENSIKSSGARKLPYKRQTLVNKMKKYARAKNEGNDALADELFADMTNDGRIDFRIIQQETGLTGVAGRDISQKGEPYMYGEFEASGRRGYDFINLDYQFMDGSSRMGPFMEDNPTFAALAGGVDGSDISNINNYRDLINQGKKNAQGLNEIAGVGGNVNKSKTNKFGDPTVEAAMGSLSKISSQLGFPPELVDALSREVVGKEKTGKPITSYGKGVTKPFLEVRNILRGIERRDVEYVLERALSGDALESLNDGAGRASRLKRPLTRLVNAAHASEEGRNLLAFMCALEPDPFITDVIYQVFDPTSKFAKRATGQTTKRPSGSASQRYGSRVDLSRAEINRLKGILQNTDNMIVASWQDILFNI
jgi:hypothetical protein